MKLRLGMEGGRRPLLAKAKQIGASILVSANSMWDNDRRKFTGWKAYAEHDTALDSGGFIAMKLYGGFRWSVAQYADLAANMRPAWWAQMDYCCEPEVAGNRSEVFKRIDRTVGGLHDCQAAARAAGIAGPMPVLQGWTPADYCTGPIYDTGFVWPDLVGVGSVCRRQVNGPEGLIAVVSALDAKLPDHVKLHLFGVKSDALRELTARFGHRVASVDSMAFSYGYRRERFKAGMKRDGDSLAEFMAAWYGRQIAKASGEYQQTFSL